ncbi:hypothetical protein [Streptomyces rectiverticillatus]|uniref:hypothetical protein n=1 Tax=Streptomyces rectiverticillatus TaxID=173860 RepID=UPI0015C38954|nr:hypothetical protein [Streptomyces rectiverticillatus]
MARPAAGQLVHERTTKLEGNADEMRQLLAERRERLFFPRYRQELRSGDYQAAGITECSSHLLGLNRPARRELSGPDEGAVQIESTTDLHELERLIGLASRYRRKVRPEEDAVLRAYRAFRAHTLGHRHHPRASVRQHAREPTNR